MMSGAVKEVLPEKYEIFGREGFVGKRTENEIGVHAVRGGNIVGEHDVIFAGKDEVITLSHSAMSSTPAPTSTLPISQPLFAIRFRTPADAALRAA